MGAPTACSTIFFFVAGLEVKQEFVPRGRWPTCARPRAHRRRPRWHGRARALYLAVSWATPDAARGWAIPTATDIAFALAVLAVTGQLDAPGRCGRSC